MSIEYTTVLLYTDITFATSVSQATLETALAAKAAEGYHVVGANQHWVLMAREFDAATPT